MPAGLLVTVPLADVTDRMGSAPYSYAPMTHGTWRALPSKSVVKVVDRFVPTPMAGELD